MPLTNPYQVQETDKDLLQIAAQQNYNFQELKGLNPNITSISPGQFINVPPKPAPIGPPTLSPGASAAVSGIQQPSGPYNVPGGVNQYLAGANLPPAYPPNYHVPGSLAAPNRPADSPPPTWGLTGDRDIESQNDMIRVYQLKTTMENATDPSQLPRMISNADAARMGFPPAQMIKAGYVMKNGNWINAKGTDGANVYGAGGGSGDFMNTKFMQYNTEHNISFYKQLRWDPVRKKYVSIGKLIREGKLDLRTGKYYKYGRNKNGKAKGAPKQRTEPGNNIRSDTPSTTLDLVLGS